MDKTLTFRISKDGRKIKMTALGIIGEECINVSKPFEDKIGKVVSDELTSDYYATETVENDIQESEGL
jgi:hypothetical protein